MKLIKAKFVKNDKPSGMAYTYKVTDDIKIGDALKDDKMSKLVVIDEEVDMAFVEKYGIENIKILERFIECEKENE